MDWRLRPLFRLWYDLGIISNLKKTMNSFLKGVLHSLASAVIMYLPFAHFSFMNMTIGAVILVVANWVISHTIPTTSGASATQGVLPPR